MPPARGAPARTGSVTGPERQPAGYFSSPGMPNTTVTPSRSRQRTSGPATLSCWAIIGAYRRTALGWRATSNPAAAACPPVGRASVHSIWAVVVWPAPFGPGNATMFPAKHRPTRRGPPRRRRSAWPRRPPRAPTSPARLPRPEPGHADGQDAEPPDHFDLNRPPRGRARVRAVGGPPKRGTYSSSELAGLRRP